MEDWYKRRRKQSKRGGGEVSQPLLMEGLASQAKPVHTEIPVGTTTKSLTYAQGHTFQAHSLQIILLGPFACEPNVVHGLLKIESLQLAPSVGMVCVLA